MCLSPIRLRTSSIYRSLKGYSKYYVDVPCGHCAECQMQKKNDWYLRNYFESVSTWLNNGYVLFDTLTYDDAHLPTISRHLLGEDINSDSKWNEKLDLITNFLESNDIKGDEFKVMQILREKNFSCFDYHDVQKFLKLLRIRLERLGYDVAENLRYFLASEYGHDELYVDKRGRTRKGTFRPHYHILFFVSGYLARSLSPELLSLFIGTCWQCGRTDGIPYREESYVLGHNTFGPKYIMDPHSLRGVQYYVSKYVCKDYDFESTVKKRISYILTQVYRISYDSPKYKEIMRNLHRHMDQFHRQSEGFGLTGFCDFKNLEYVFSEGKVKIPDSKDGVKIYSIPQYYVRKLFQKCVKDSEGRLHWVWNDLGKQWQLNRVRKNIDILSQKMIDWFDNMSVYTDLHVSFRPKIQKLLNGRSWRDYAEYFIVYKGRFYSDPLNPSTDISEVISSSLESPYSLESDKYFKRVSPGVYSYDGNIYSSSDLESSYVIDDSCLGGKYSGFDMISDIYRISMDEFNVKKQILYEDRIRESKRLKSYGIKVKNY